VLDEASELLDDDAGSLTIPHSDLERIGLRSHHTYASALEEIIRSGDRRMARDFTGVILKLRSDERVQGAELILA
ncbi:MAG: hypothetical protein AB7K24_25360, partial [Gemmataceae bacterium]